MMGNVVIWKPSDSQVFSAQIIIEYSKKQVFLTGYQRSFGDALMVTDTVLASRDFAGLLYFYSRI
jgi:1-pyrroline-5-carboxylate dehydrogenase